MLGRCLPVLVSMVLFVSELRAASLPSFVMGRPSQGFLNFALPPSSVDADASPVETFTIEQFIDHANPDLGKWLQRVQYNPSFYKNEELIFLMIGGESEASESWLTHNVTYINWARKYGAAVFQLEHRFFGFSRPFNDTTVTSLRYLTMAQAIDDVAEFITQMNNKYGYKNPRWVTFGGSYPGCLNAWFRAKYPSLTVGAVASSAAINMKLDFYEYAMVVENALNVTNPQCKENVRKAFEAIISKALTAAGRSELNVEFNLDPPFNETTLRLIDLQNFVANMFGVFQGVIQYTYARKIGYDVSTLCEKINDSTFANDPLAQLKAVMNWTNAFSNNGMFPNSYQAVIEQYGSTTFDVLSDSAWRGWMWMSCNERGYMQTTDQGRNAFGNMIPLNYYIDMCTDLFGVEVNSIRNGNENAKKIFPGSDGYNATNIVFVSGSLDPWSALGNYKSVPTQHITTILIEGTSHCADMYQQFDGEPAALAAARQTIEDELQYFIQPKGDNGAAEARMSAWRVLLFALLTSTISLFT